MLTIKKIWLLSIFAMISLQAEQGYDFSQDSSNPYRSHEEEDHSSCSIDEPDCGEEKPKEFNYIAYRNPCCRPAQQACGPCEPVETCYEPCEERVMRIPVNLCGFYLGADFLWWTTCQSNLDFASENPSGQEDDLRIGKGKRHHNDYDWDPGYRVFFGWNNGCDAWDLRLAYTQFCNSGTLSLSDSTELYQGTLLLGGTAFDDTFSSVTAKNESEYQVVDLTLYRPYRISSSFLMRPHLGFRTVWLDLDEKVTYTNSNEVDTVHWTSDYHGYGLNVGFDWNVNLLTIICDESNQASFGLTGNFGGSVVYGDANDHNKQYSDVDTFVDETETRCLCLPGIHVATALSWNTCICSVDTVFRLGYEFNHWWNAPQPRRYPLDSGKAASASTNNSVNFHGMTLDGEIHF